MTTSIRRCCAVLLVFCLCLAAPRPAHADIAYTHNGKAIGVIVAVVAVGALIGFGVYYAVHHGHSLKGCTAASAGGLQLINDGDKETYALTGNVQGIHAGDRVHVAGSKVKHDGQARTFSVTHMTKDDGACRVP